MRNLRRIRKRLVHDAAQIREQGGEGSRVPRVLWNRRRRLNRVSVLGRDPAASYHTFLKAYGISTPPLFILFYHNTKTYYTVSNKVHVCVYHTDDK